MTVKSLCLVFALGAGFLSMQTGSAETQLATANQSQSVTLAIQNMTCPLCQFTIKKAIQGVDGVQEISVDYDNKIALILFDPQKTNTDALIKATANAGYPATVRPVE